MRIQIQKTLALAREKFPHGGEIALAVYPDEESFTALRNPDGMQFSEHREIVNETSAALEAEGYKIRIVEISQAEYLQWLGDELNTTTTRAQFIALKTGEDNEQYNYITKIPQCGGI